MLLLRAKIYFSQFFFFGYEPHLADGLLDMACLMHAIRG